MSGSAIEWSPPRTIGIAPAATTWLTTASIAACVRAGSDGSTGASPKSIIRSAFDASSFASRCGPHEAARSADRAGAEAGSGPVGDEVVRGCSDDRDVHAFELGGVLGPGQRPEREQARVVRLLAVLAPAVQRVDHRLVAASRSWTMRSAARALAGWPVTAARKSCFPSAYKRADVCATTSAVRGTSRRSAISPKLSPRPSRFRRAPPLETSS
jgi:hypothetical protein